MSLVKSTKIMIISMADSWS